MVNAISVSVFKNPLYKGCANGGISERYDDVLLICEDGPLKVDLDNPPENLCKVVERNIGGRVYRHVEPVENPTGLGWMAGGTFVSSSDSRFPGDYPLSLHDRQETVAQYAICSR